MTLTAKLIIPIVCSLLTSSAAFSQNTPPRTLVAIFAHPDDERIVGAVLSRYAREGHQVHLVIATDGRKGVTQHAGIPAGDSLAMLRVVEARCATRELGINDPILLELEDAGLASFASLGKLRSEVQRIFAEIKPDAVITFGPEGGTGHPDHRLVGDVVTEVVQRGGDGITTALYYPSVPTERMSDAPPARPQVNSMSMKYLTVRVPYQERDFAAAIRAYACHKTQYTEAQVIANMNYLRHAFNGTVYFRAWNNTAAKSELF
jgi:LmbE family N-acetylglucosaminyl deacetylase